MDELIAKLTEDLRKQIYQNIITAKSAADLQKKIGAIKIDVSAEDAQMLYNAFHASNVELSADDLENVSGGCEPSGPCPQ